MVGFPQLGAQALGGFSRHALRTRVMIAMGREPNGGGNTMLRAQVKTIRSNRIRATAQPNCHIAARSMGSAALAGAAYS